MLVPANLFASISNLIATMLSRIRFQEEIFRTFARSFTNIFPSAIRPISMLVILPDRVAIILRASIILLFTHTHTHTHERTARHMRHQAHEMQLRNRRLYHRQHAYPSRRWPYTIMIIFAAYARNLFCSKIKQITEDTITIYNIPYTITISSMLLFSIMLRVCPSCMRTCREGRLNGMSISQAL